MKPLLGLALVGMLLGSCAQQDERPQAAAILDDDAICQTNGSKPGSDAYVRCRRDRDHVNSLQSQKSQRDQRKVQDFMMDNK